MKTLLQVIFCFAFLENTVIGQNSWTFQDSQITGDQKVIFTIIATDPLSAWAGVLDYNTNPPACEFTKTVDGGDTWVSGSISQSSNHQLMSLSALNKDTAWAATIKLTAGPGDIYRTYDGGSTWTRLDTAMYKGATSFPDDIYFYSKDTGLCFGDPESGYFEIYTTVNAGNNWTRVKSENIPAPLANEGCYQDVFYVVKDTIWVGTTAGRILKSTDKGLSWNVTAPFPTNVAVRALAFRDCKNGLVFGGGINNYKRTTDGGSNWDSFPILSGSYSFSFGKSLIYVKGNASKPGYYLCGGKSNSYHFANYSIDDGENWNEIDQMYHSCFGFYDATTGWSCAFLSSTIAPEIYKFNNLSSGIKDYTNQPVISIYPNPSSGLINILFKEHVTHTEITNIFGEVIFSEDYNLDKEKTQVDLTSQPTGIYFMKLKDKTKVIGKSKIIICK